MNEWLTNIQKFKTGRLFWSVSGSSKRHEPAGRGTRLLKGFQYYNIRFQSSWKLTSHLSTEKANQPRKNTPAVYKKRRGEKKKSILKSIWCAGFGWGWVNFLHSSLYRWGPILVLYWAQYWYYRSVFISQQSLHKAKAFSALHTIPPARRLRGAQELGGGTQLTPNDKGADHIGVMLSM